MATESVPMHSKSLIQLRNLIKSRIPIIHVTTGDEKQLINALASITNLEIEAENNSEIPPPPFKKFDRELFVWSAWQGVTKYTDSDVLVNPERACGDWDQSWNPQKALELIVKHKSKEPYKGSIFIMRDMNTVLVQPITRQMRDIYEHLIENYKVLVIVSNHISHGAGGNTPGIEPTLEKQISILKWDLPSREDIENRIVQMFDNTEFPSTWKTKYTPEEIYACTRSLQGLTELEVESSIAICMAEMQALDPVRLLEEKKQIIRRSDILEYIESSDSMDKLGGLDNLKNWIKAHTDAYTDEAETFGVEPPKGVLLLGVPGTGKSAMAKALGNYWKIPTLRLDVGKVMSGLVGSSEQNMRKVIATVSSVAPVILWVDEIEKALSGTKSSNHSDGGTLARVFGTLLTAMEESLKGVTIVATANDISALPPELIRRFSEVFFVTLPVKSEREEIFKIHLTKKKRDPKDFDLDKLTACSDRYTGAEIEKAIKEAIATTFNEGKRKLTTKDLVKAIAETKPIAVLMKDKINETIDWARDKARFASSLAAMELAPGKQKIKTKSGKELSVESVEEVLPAPSKSNKNTRISDMEE